MKRIKFVIIGTGLLGILLFQNCSMVTAPDVEQASLTALSAEAILEAKAVRVIQNRCAGCHNPQVASGDIDYITDLDALLFYKLVVPGEPQISKLYTEIQSGNMPPGNPLSASEVQDVYNWIQDGFPGEILPAPGPTQPTGPPAKFSEVLSNILQPKCISCHGANNPAAGLSLNNYSNVMKAVTPGDPVTSELYIATSSGQMPKNANKLTATQVQMIRSWIQSGAPNN